MARDDGDAGVKHEGGRYAPFTFEARLDWVELKVTLARPSQSRHVRARLPEVWGKPFVTALTDDSSRTAREFIFRVQDPGGPAAIMSGLQTLADAGAEINECDVEVLGVEVALDAFHAGRDDSALVALAFDLFTRQALLPLSAIGPRISPPATAGSRAAVAATPGPTQRALEQGWTINHGTRGGDFERRWYVKRQDTRDGEAYKDLPAAAHRARAEVTLRGARLPFKTIEGWRQFRFQTLRRLYFAWRVPTEHLIELPGIPRKLGRVEGSERGRDRRKTTRHTRPDDELHRHAKHALERLTRKQRRG